MITLAPKNIKQSHALRIKSKSNSSYVFPQITQLISLFYFLTTVVQLLQPAWKDINTSYAFSREFLLTASA